MHIISPRVIPRGLFIGRLGGLVKIVQTSPNRLGPTLSTQSYGHYSHSWFTNIYSRGLSLVDTCPVLWPSIEIGSSMTGPSTLPSSPHSLRRTIPLTNDTGWPWPSSLTEAPSSLTEAPSSCEKHHRKWRWGYQFILPKPQAYGEASLRKPCGAFGPHPQQRR
jgi:hypothetical protein